MFCYHCGCHLSEHDFCTACGADVSLYKKIMNVSNLFYNEGLERAGVRDLTGAITSLRQSLKFNKNNIEARNLLGLVYFEMGEVVAALSEWVISKNLRPEKNIADDYIDMLQSNASRLDAINQTIKKYNQALVYCLQDSKDLAVIQLKKVLSLNPKFVRAHQLLALLYMDAEEWERAQRELKKCLDIDRNSTLTLRYLKEVEIMLAPDENVKPVGRKKRDDAVRYQSDNEVIIQPLNVREQKVGGVSTLVNIGIGLVIGLAAMYFLVVPAAVSNVNNEAQKTITEIGNQLDAKTSRIQEIEQQLSDLQAENDDLNQELQGIVGTDGTLQTIDNLLTAATAYLETQDIQQTAANLESIAQSINVEDTSDAFQSLYHTLLGTIGPELSEQYYTEGYSAVRSEDYTVAIENLAKAFYYDETHVDALLELGNVYRKCEDVDNAIATYDKVIELFPDTEQARKAQRNRDNLMGEATN
ncbi:MAG: tetratricopeptide repeat protein [Lachnospiraceae bacterium]|nr:tetratricopeptide repeat protein [Lachnospiraceae bacterium]